MSRQKKRAYLALMAIGVAALAIDRFFLQDGVAEPGAALAFMDATLAAATSDPDSETAQPLSIPELPFPRELKPLGQMFQVRDLFAPPISIWDPRTEAKLPDKAGSGTGQDDGTGHSSGAARLTQRRLAAVFIRHGLRIAVVDKAWVEIGQVLDDCTLLGISGNQAEFECPDEDVVLYIVKPKSTLQD